jgi:hypothetical protein
MGSSRKKAFWEANDKVSGESEVGPHLQPIVPALSASVCR